MSNLFEKIGSVIATIGVAIGGFFGFTPEPEVQYVPETVYVPQEEETLGADAVLPIAGVTYYLSGTGISSSATSFTLTSFTVTQNGKKIQDSEMSETFYFTLEPGSRTRQEIVSCTTVTQNSDGTATISGCTRGLAPVTPYTASTTLQFAHAGGSIAIISNPPQLYNQVAIKDNDETITGLWDFPGPVSGNNPATKDYVLSVVTGGAITIDSTIIGGVAGETFATGTIVYLNPTDARWYKASASSTSKYLAKQLGIAQSNGSSGNSVLAGVLIYGTDDSTQSAMTPGGTLWLSDTAGATSSATTTQALGIVVDATTLIFNPQVNTPATLGGGNFGTPSTTNKFLTERFQQNVLNVQEFTASSTWTMPDYGNMVLVELWGAGGGGGGGERNSTPDGGKGGGGGAYIYKLFKRSDLSPTTTAVTIGYGGRGGTVNNQGAAGGNTTFGSYLTGYGGGSGQSGDGNYTGGGGGGWLSAGSNGLSTAQAHGGNPRVPYSATYPIYYDVNMGGGTGYSGDGGYAWYGGGAGGGGGSGIGGSSMFGGGGGGVGKSTPGAAGGGYGIWQVGGGAAGCVGVGATGSNGTFGQGGGGGCSGTGATAAGAGGNGGTAGGGGGGGEYDTDSGSAAGGVGGNGGNGFARITVY